MLLLLLACAPLAAAALVLFASGKDGPATLRLALLLALGIAGASLALVLGPPPATWSCAWFTLPGAGAQVRLALGCDGLSAWLILLTAWLTPAALLGARIRAGGRMREFAACLLAAEGFIIGALLARDLVLFYLCFEAMLLPILVLTAAFGGKDRRGAALHFLVYTLAGSLALLGGIWYLAWALGTTDLERVVAGLGTPPTAQAADLLGGGAKGWLFAAFCLAFLVKVPVPPLHGWQARIYAEAPPAAVVLLGAVMAKLGLYGLLRFVLPCFPAEAAAHAPLIQGLALVGVLGGALVALAQDDAKRLLAWSSLSHLGLVVLGIFSFEASALAGAPVLMVAHGLSLAALFLLIGALEDRNLGFGCEEHGGLARRAPFLAVLFTVAILASVAVPGSLNFAGEFALLFGLWQAGSPWLAAAAGLSVILSAVYLLRLVQGWIFGRAAPETEARPMDDLAPAEALAVVPLLVATFVLGFAPSLITGSLGGSYDAAAIPARSERRLLDPPPPTPASATAAVPAGGQP